jgi:hypothetical protein
MRCHRFTEFWQQAKAHDTCARRLHYSRKQRPFAEAQLVRNDVICLVSSAKTITLLA